MICEFKDSFAHPEDSWSGITAMINKTHSVPEFHEIIKGRLIHIKIQSKETSKITNVFSYYGYHRNKKHDNNQLEAHINFVNQRIINEKLS